jgi:hypothetical protein
VNPFPLQPEASELPEAVSPSHTEALALPRAPPSPVAPEISPETEQNLVPVQEVRHEVIICTQSCYLLFPNTPDSAMLFFQDQAPLSSNPPMGNNPIAETRERVPQALSEEVQEKLKEIFVWLQREARDQIRDLDYFEDMLRPISQELPEDVRASLEPISGLDVHYVAIR